MKRILIQFGLCLRVNYTRGADPDKQWSILADDICDFLEWTDEIDNDN